MPFIKLGASIFWSLLTLSLTAPLDPYQARGPHQTSSAKLSALDTVWYPNPLPEGKLGAYLFVVGTSATPANYEPTLDHIASHGFIAVGVGNHEAGGTCSPESVGVVINMLSDDTKLPAQIQGHVDASNIVVGGHSGGGPCALKAAGQHGSVVHGSISQHGAAIPFVNRLSDAEIKALPGAVMTLCGTIDTVPYCGCSSAQVDYYGRLPATLPRVGIAVKGVTHLSGTQGTSGDKHEGGYAVAFLYSILKHDGNAAQALVHGIEPRGDAYQAGAWPPAANQSIVV